MLRTLILAIALLTGCQNTKPLAPDEVSSATSRIKSSLDKINTVYYPSVRPGGWVSCTVYYSKRGHFLLKARNRKRDEMEIGMNADARWFWVRNHDPRFAYSYGDAESILVKDEFRPDIISSFLGVGLPDSEWSHHNGLAKATLVEGDHERVVFADSEKIVRQEIWRDGLMVGSADVTKHSSWEDAFLPRTIKITSMEGSAVVDLGMAEVNKGEMETVPSHPLKKL